MQGKNHSELAERWAGLRVAVTGGTSGLGLALVRELRLRGAEVALVARERERVRSVALHSGAHGIVGDVADKQGIHRIALQITGLLGGLDVLINNASELGPAPLALLADTECEALEAALATNLLGPFRLGKALLGALAASAREGRGAVVLNVSSDAGINPYPRWGAYGASKAALHHLSRIWNEELAGQGVRVLSLDPGDMDTPLHRLAAVPEADADTPKSAPRPRRAVAGCRCRRAAAAAHRGGCAQPAVCAVLGGLDMRAASRADAASAAGPAAASRCPWPGAASAALALLRCCCRGDLVIANDAARPCRQACTACIAAAAAPSKCGWRAALRWPPMT